MHDAIPVVGGHPAHGAVDGDAGVVDEDVDPAVLLEHLGDHALAVGDGADVALVDADRGRAPTPRSASRRRPRRASIPPRSSPPARAGPGRSPARCPGEPPVTSATWPFRRTYPRPPSFARVYPSGRPRTPVRKPSSRCPSRVANPCRSARPARARTPPSRPPRRARSAPCAPGGSRITLLEHLRDGDPVRPCLVVDLPLDQRRPHIARADGHGRRCRVARPRGRASLPGRATPCLALTYPALKARPPGRAPRRSRRSGRRRSSSAGQA